MSKITWTTSVGHAFLSQYLVEASNLMEELSCRWVSINLHAYFSYRFLVLQGTPQYLNDQSETEVASNVGESNTRHQLTR